MKILIGSLSIVLATTSCGQLRLDGSHVGGYCVPREHAISSDWGLWEKNRAGGGRAFAFHGCLPHMNRCNIPKVVAGGVIEPLSKTDWLWDKIPEDSFYRQVLVEGVPSLEISENGRYALLSNPSVTQDWYIWQLPRNNSDNESVIGSGARLMAVCRNSKKAYSHKTDRAAHIISCKRFVQNADFGLFYDFNPATRSPVDFIELDTRIMRVVESWRCRNSSAER